MADLSRGPGSALYTDYPADDDLHSTQTVDEPPTMTLQGTWDLMAAGCNVDEIALHFGVRRTICRVFMNRAAMAAGRGDLHISGEAPHRSLDFLRSNSHLKAEQHARR